MYIISSTRLEIGDILNSDFVDDLSDRDNMWSHSLIIAESNFHKVIKFAMDSVYNFMYPYLYKANVSSYKERKSYFITEEISKEYLKKMIVIS